jgi:hypothetical protein
VPANAKWYRNLVIAESIVSALRDHKKNWARRLKEMGKAGRMELDDYRAQHADGGRAKKKSR